MFRIEWVIFGEQLKFLILKRCLRLVVVEVKRNFFQISHWNGFSQISHLTECKNLNFGNMVFWFHFYRHLCMLLLFLATKKQLKCFWSMGQIRLWKMYAFYKGVWGDFSEKGIDKHFYLVSDDFSFLVVLTYYGKIPF